MIYLIPCYKYSLKHDGGAVQNLKGGLTGTELVLIKPVSMDFIVCYQTDSTRASVEMLHIHSQILKRLNRNAKNISNALDAFITSKTKPCEKTRMLKL